MPDLTISRRKRYLTRWSDLVTERSSWIDHWREISQYLLPRSGRFFLTDTNRGDRRYNKIYDNTGTRALGVLAAGLMAGVTSPARPWFRVGTTNTDLMEYDSVKLWLDRLTKLMLSVFARSNTYRALHGVYKELGSFNTALTIVDSDFDTVIHMSPQTAGQYCITTNGKDEVDTMFREFEMTVWQMAEKFGPENLSTTARSLYDSHRLDQWVPVIHVIEPRTDRDYSKRDALSMPWSSCYFESGGNDDKFLRESGYRDFPVLAPRWEVAGGDIYGNGPGMEALGDVKQLQQEQLRKGQGIDYQTLPPLQIPTTLRNAGHSTLPGGVSYYDSAQPSGGIRTAFDVNLNLEHLLMDIQDVRQRINSAFYVDLFLMLANNPDPTAMTAREIAERHEEKLLMLGPVLERLHNELLSPLIDITFRKIVEAGIMPTPPRELQGQAINIEFISVLAQAQRAIGTNSVDRLLATVGAVAQFKPDVVDKIDSDQLVDKYADMLGVDPDLIMADEKVAFIRQQRAQMQQQQAAAAAAPAAAQTAKTLADTPTDGDTALNGVINQFQGYGGA